MTPQEASEMIAKFMGYKKLDSLTRTSRFDIRWVKGKKRMSSLDFHRSLDALVPVWEKLKVEGRWMNDISCDQEKYWFYLKSVGDAKISEHGWTATIQEAAAIATAKAIQEQEKGGK